MKINEIAINEGIEKFGKYVFNTAKNAWELANDTKALSKGGVKSADNLVSPAELSALRRDPAPPSSGPAVWRKRGDPNFDTTPSTLQGPSTGGTVPKPIVPATKSRANTSAYDREVRNAHDMNPGMPNKGKPSAEAEAYAAEKAAQAARTAAEKQAADDWAKAFGADDLSKQIKPGGRADPPMTPGGQAYPEMIAEPLPSWLSPKGAKGSKTTGGQQSSGSKRDPSMDQPPPAGPGGGPGVHPDWSKPPTPVININTGKESSFPWKTTAAAAAFLGPTAYNQFSPPTAPKLSNTPLSLTGDALVYAGKNFMANQNIPGVKSVTPVSNNDQPVAPPTQDAVNNAIKSDPENQAVTQEIEKWNRDHPDNQIKESYTNELNRLVYLSRL
jgi:hypothetical protein